VLAGTPDTVAFDADVHAWYSNVIHLRHSLPALRRGTFRSLYAEGDVYIFERAFDADTLIVALNRNSGEKTVTLQRTGQWEERMTGTLYELDLPLRIGGRTSMIFLRSLTER